MSTDPAPTTFNPLAGLAALIVPGAGHFIRGERGRGALIAVGILGLFFGGILIGGIDAIDSKEDRLWFLGQALVGPIAFGVDYIHQHNFKGVELKGELLATRKITTRQLADLSRLTRSARPDETRKVVEFQVVDDATGASRGTARIAGLVKAGPGEGPPSRKSLSKVNELGTLFATIAGMLNIIVLLDAAFPALRPRQVGLRTTHADAQRPLSAPTTVDDPLRGATPGRPR